jgi:hypothetical protein
MTTIEKGYDSKGELIIGVIFILLIIGLAFGAATGQFKSEAEIQQEKVDKQCSLHNNDELAKSPAGCLNTFINGKN